METPELKDVNGTVLQPGDVVVKGGYHGGIMIGVVRGVKHGEGYYSQKYWLLSVDIPAKIERYYDPVHHKASTSQYNMPNGGHFKTITNAWRRVAWKNATHNVMKIGEVTEQGLIEKHSIGQYHTYWTTYDTTKPWNERYGHTLLHSGVAKVNTVA